MTFDMRNESRKLSSRSVYLCPTYVYSFSTHHLPPSIPDNQQPSSHNYCENIIKQRIWKQPEQCCTDLSEPPSTAERSSDMRGPSSHTFVHRLAGCRPFPPLHQQTLNHQLRVKSLNYWNSSELLKYCLPW